MSLLPGRPDAPSPDVVIRELRRADLEEYLRLALANSGEFERTVGLLDRAEEQLGALRRPGVWAVLSLLRLLGRSPVRLLVADEQGEVVGSTVTVLLGPWAYVAGVGVRADRRRRGIAEALVRRAEAIGRRSGTTTMVLEVDAGNEPARRLYSRLGWRTGLTTRWWELPVRPAGGQHPRPRRARRAERQLAHASAESLLGHDLPTPYVHPSELVCRGPARSHPTLAAGEVGSPTLLIRAFAGRSGLSGFLLPVATRASAGPGEAELLDGVRRTLEAAGDRSIFVPVLGVGSRLDELLAQAGGAPRATTEFWSKPIARAPTGPGPRPWVADAPAPAG